MGYFMRTLRVIYYLSFIRIFAPDGFELTPKLILWQLQTDHPYQYVLGCDNIQKKITDISLHIMPFFVLLNFVA